MTKVLWAALALMICAVPASALTFTETPGDGSVLFLEPGAANEDYARLLVSADPVVTPGRTSVSAIADAAYKVTFRYFYDGNPGLSSFGYHVGGTDFGLTDPAGPSSQDGSASFLVGAGSAFGWFLASEPRIGGVADAVGFSADIAPIPAPASLMLLASAAAALFGMRLRRSA